MVSLNGSSANVSWTSLDVPHLPVSYTVLYSIVPQPPAEEENAVFQPPATSGVITGLVLLATYQIQVFATVTVGGVEIAGNKSHLVYFTNSSFSTVIVQLCKLRLIKNHLLCFFAVLSPTESETTSPSLTSTQVVVAILAVVTVICGTSVLTTLVILVYQRKKLRYSSIHWQPVIYLPGL